MKKVKEYRSQISLTLAELSDSALLVGSGFNLPLPKSQEKASKALASLGWFGGDGDLNTFYPGMDVQAEVIPKPEDFIPVPYRLLSETVVAAGTWRATAASRSVGW